jgi:hypothetical protein
MDGLANVKRKVCVLSLNTKARTGKDIFFNIKKGIKCSILDYLISFCLNYVGSRIIVMGTNYARITVKGTMVPYNHYHANVLLWNRYKNHVLKWKPCLKHLLH